MKTHETDSQYPKQIALFPKQRELCLIAEREFKSQGYSFLKLGQRSGKTVMSGELARPFKQVFMFEEHDTLNGQFSNAYNFCGTKIPEEIEDGPKESKLAIINEAMWTQFSYDLFESLRVNAIVLVISSNGPEYQDQRWRDLPGHTAATWEVNPNVSREDVMKANDPYAERDYGAF